MYLTSEITDENDYHRLDDVAHTIEKPGLSAPKIKALFNGPQRACSYGEADDDE